MFVEIKMKPMLGIGVIIEEENWMGAQAREFLGRKCVINSITDSKIYATISGGKYHGLGFFYKKSSIRMNPTRTICMAQGR